jgi:hypothetical protein
MQVLNIDTIGPLPADQFGKAYILTIIDCFTRWTELYATVSTAAVDAAVPLIQHIGRFGAPSVIKSDRGPQFVNQMISETMKLVGTHHHLTLAYSKQENAIVERDNKEIMRHLTAILFDKRVHDTWSESDLPMTQRILNTTEKSAIGVTPAELLFGGAVNLDRGLFTNKPINENVLKVSAHADKMLARQQLLLKVAREHQLEKDEAHLASGVGTVTEYPINSYVLVEYVGRPPDKFTTRWKGPMQVINKVGSKYTVQDLITKKLDDIHVTRLKRFDYDAARTDPREVAMHDQSEFEIDRIIAHRGDRKNKTTMTFLVHWLGFSDAEDSWEPWENLRHTEQLHHYLRNNRMVSLIPQSNR